MRIKVPFEVALVFVVLIILFWVLIGAGALGRWIERKLSPRAHRIVATSIAVLTTGGGLWLFSTFYFLTDQRHPVHRGLSLFDLGDVILAAVLVAVGGAAFAWARLRPVGAVVTLLSAVALLLKPIAIPLMSEYTPSWGPDRGVRTVHPYGLTSETHLYFILSALGLLVVGIVLLVSSLRKSQPATSRPAAGRAGGGAGWQSRSPSKPVRTHERIIAAPDYAFDRIDSNMQRLNLRLAAQPYPSTVPGEPGSASWTDGTHTVTYHYLAEHGLRLLDVQGARAEFVRNDILNLVYMPTLEGYKVSSLLKSEEPAAQLRGIFAAEHIGIHGNEKYYIDPLGRLCQSTDPQVAAQAARVRDVLLARQREAA